MVNINILSDDILYARMLMHELRSTYGTENENLNTTINGLTQNESYISVVDLDSKYVSESFNSPYIIGFTTYESIKVSKKYPFCNEIFIRPFLIKDLISTISRILKKQFETNNDSPSPSEPDTTLFFEENNNIRFLGNRIHLSKNEYDILLYLDDKQSMIVSRDEINLILGGECGNMCDVYICRLRQKLSAFSDKKIIFTIRNKGYMLKLK